MANIFGFTPESGLTLAGYVTTDTPQTIAGEKTFDNDLICTQNITTDNLVLGDGTIQVTAYKSLTPGTYANSTVTVDANGAISSITAGGGGTLVTTDTVQTITANKTFSGTIRFGNAQLKSNGGTIAVALTGTSITAPLKDYYFLSGLASGSSLLTLPDATAALDGTEITFRRVVNTSGNLAIRQVNDTGNIYGPGIVLPGNNSAVVMASTSYSCKILCANNNWYGIRDDV